MSAGSDWDVVIIGAGLGGSAVAYALRDAGLSILLLERGGYLKQEQQNWDPEEVIARRRYDTAEEWLDENGERFSPRIYYNVGGSSKFFGGVALRFRLDDFVARSYPEGDTVGWPISYEELAPYYDEAERLMWVHGKAGMDPTDPPREDYAYPPLLHEPAVAWLARQLHATGLRPVSLPVAVDQGEGGRCRKGSPCDGFPCKIRAKGDGENSFLRPAIRDRRSSNIKVVTGAKVVRLTHDEAGRSVVAAEYVCERERHVVTARLFVLAAGTGNSPALLLRSATSRYPRGLANSSDQVGRNYMSHNNTVLMAFSPFRRNPTRFQKTLAFNDFYRPDAYGPKGSSGRTGQVLPAGHIQMRGKVLPQNLKKSPRWFLRLFAGFIAKRSFDFWLMSEDLALAENRIELVSQPDGEPGIRLTRRLSNLGPHRALVREFRRRLRRAGLPIVLEREPSPRTIQHQCGTLRSGNDPRTSVVDASGRTHDLTNLYVADASVFPSSAAVNPALTVAAMALRVGGQIRRVLTT